MLKKLAFGAESSMYATKLSGGQMRKLCVAIALINSPKVCSNLSGGSAYVKQSVFHASVLKESHTPVS